MGTKNIRQFTVHENLIRSSSKFFDKVLDEGRKEAIDGVVKLSVDIPGTFQLYVH